MRELTFTLFDGTFVDEVTVLNQFKVIAKRVKTENLDRFFLKELNSRIINPAEITLADLKRDEGSMVEVSKDVFDLYHKVISNNSRTSYSSIQSMI